jgi:hypothetical protein
MMMRKTPSETSLFPENIAPITTVQSAIELSSRRKKTFALDGDGAGAFGSDMDEQSTRPTGAVQNSVAKTDGPESKLKAQSSKFKAQRKFQFQSSNFQGRSKHQGQRSNGRTLLRFRIGACIVELFLSFEL